MQDIFGITPMQERVFRDAMSHLASGVVVLTVRSDDGSHRGMTASAFTSLSLKPPMVVVCVGKQSACAEILLDRRPFGVSILSEDQADLAQRFATPLPDKFEGVPVRPGSCGALLLEGCCASLECQVAARHEGGDHWAIFGQVKDVVVPGGKPLVFACRSFHGLPENDQRDGGPAPIGADGRDVWQALFTGG